MLPKIPPSIKETVPETYSLLFYVDVEFTMPLRQETKTRLNNSDENPKNSSFDSCYDTMDERTDPSKVNKYMYFKLTSV